jgi:ABC-type molybdenum transport system ATPase subunit/photorepair protein PhrA
MMLEVGEKVAILGTNGIGKSTLIKTLVGELAPDSSAPSSGPRTPRSATTPRITPTISTPIENVFDWMAQWKQANEDEQAVRSVLGRLLFTQDDIKKPVKVLSGGEQGRMLFGKLMMQRPNILIMDEPTNHLDMESIESLNLALEMYQGTLIFVSHDREFVSSLATRILDPLTENGIRDFGGTYEDYLRSQGYDYRLGNLPPVRAAGACAPLLAGPAVGRADARTGDCPDAVVGPGRCQCPGRGRYRLDGARPSGRVPGLRMAGAVSAPLHHDVPVVPRHGTMGYLAGQLDLAFKPCPGWAGRWPIRPWRPGPSTASLIY